MMVVKILIVLIAVGGAVGLIYTDCFMEGIDQCDYINPPHSLPDTFEELKQDCIVVQEMVKCGLNVSKGCPGSENLTSKLEKLLAYLEKHCQENSNVYQVMSQNYECILPLARNKNEECSIHRLHTDDVKELMSMVDQFKDKSMCLELIYELTCSEHIVGLECGYDAYTAVRRILRNIDIRYQECSKETLTELTPFAQAVQSAISRSRIPNVKAVECPEDNGFFAVPGHCEYFLKCSDGRAEVDSCIYGYLFDSAKYCTNPANDPDCGLPTPEQKELNSYCKMNYRNYPYQHDCRKYVYCEGNRGELKSCPENHVYHNFECVQSDTCL